MKKTLKVIEVRESFVNKEGKPVFTIKLFGSKTVSDGLGTVSMQETYYHSVTDPKVVEGQDITIEMDNYEVFTKLKPKKDDPDTMMRLKVLFKK